MRSYLNPAMLQLVFNKLLYGLGSALGIGPSYSLMLMQPFASRGLEQVGRRVLAD